MPLVITLLGGIRATVFAGLALIAALGLGVQSARLAHQRIEFLARELAASRAIAAAQHQQRELEQRHAAQMAVVGERYEQDKAAALAVATDVLSGLRTGAVRMRQAWTHCERRLSKASTATGQRDAATPDRAALAAAIVRAGREADAQIRACQAVIHSDHDERD